MAVAVVIARAGGRGDGTDVPAAMSPPSSLGLTAAVGLGIVIVRAGSRGDRPPSPVGVVVVWWGLVRRGRVVVVVPAVTTIPRYSAAARQSASDMIWLSPRTSQSNPVPVFSRKLGHPRRPNR